MRYDLRKNINNLTEMKNNIIESLILKGSDITHNNKIEAISKFIDELNIGDKTYSPELYMDEDYSNYFYIDFLQDIENFSLGMFTEFMIVIGKTIVTPTTVVRVNSHVFKVYMDLTTMGEKLHLINTNNHIFKFTNGEYVDIFYSNMDILNVVSTELNAYLYDNTLMTTHSFDAGDNLLIQILGMINTNPIKDSCDMLRPSLSIVNDGCSIEII